MSVHKGSPTKDGRCWYYRIRINKKGYKSPKYVTKKEAQEQEALMKLKKECKCGNFALIGDDYINNLLKTRKESTAYGHNSVYKTNIRPYFEKKDIGNINKHDIVFWKEKLIKKGFSRRYLNKCYCILNSIFNYAIKNYNLEKNVVSIIGNFEVVEDKVIKTEDKIKYITFEEFEKFISVVDDEFWYTFFYFLYYTGMRKGEVQALTWNDIDFNNNNIKVNKTLSVKCDAIYKITNTKTGENRTITMNKSLKEVLFKHFEKQKQYEDYSNKWFVFGNTEPLKQHRIDTNKHKYFKMSGVHEIKIHEFRHSHVSLLINEMVKKGNGKVDATKLFVSLSNRLGHTIPVMQKTYMHLFPSVQDEIVNILDNL